MGEVGGFDGDIDGVVGVDGEAGVVKTMEAELEERGVEVELSNGATDDVVDIADGKAGEEKMEELGIEVELSDGDIDGVGKAEEEAETEE